MKDPLHLYLDREHPREGKRMAGYLQFAGCEEGIYRYRNKITRSLIAVDESGSLVSRDNDALHTIAIYQTLFPKRKYRRKEGRS